MEELLLGSHVLAGSLSLIAGVGALSWGRKGGRPHRLFGICYFWSMGWIFVTALLIPFLYRFNGFLVFISIFSFYLAFSGFRVLDRKSPGSHKAIDWVAALGAVSATLIVACLALLRFLKGGAGLVEFLSLFFGFFSIQAAWVDIRVFMGKAVLRPRWWLYHHIQAMVGSFIAAITAFLVQNGSRVLGNPGFQWIFWVAPTLAGVLYINFMVGRYRRRYAGTSGE